MFTKIIQVILCPIFAARGHKPFNGKISTKNGTCSAMGLLISAVCPLPHPLFLPVLEHFSCQARTHGRGGGGQRGKSVKRDEVAKVVRVRARGRGGVEERARMRMTRSDGGNRAHERRARARVRAGRKWRSTSELRCARDEAQTARGKHSNVNDR